MLGLVAQRTERGGARFHRWCEDDNERNVSPAKTKADVKQ
jgi:hypothetical protein